MKRERFHDAGRLRMIIYTEQVAISVGERGYARIVARPTAATLRRLEGLAARRFGSGMDIDTVNAGIVYHGPWKFLAALVKTQVFVWRARRGWRPGTRP